MEFFISDIEFLPMSKFCPREKLPMSKLSDFANNSMGKVIFRMQIAIKTFNIVQNAQNVQNIRNVLNC